MVANVHFYQNNYLLHLDDDPVYVSTEINETFDNNHFQLKAGSYTLLLHGVLCENGMCPDK